MASQTQAVTRTEDGRYIVVDGRRWRASDPSIPDELRTELVSELMAARRAVGSAEVECETSAALRRVHDAKVALGERGVAWWETPDDSAMRSRTAAALRAMLRKRDADATVCPSDIARIVGGDSWREVMPVVRAVVGELQASDHVEIRQRGEVVPVGEPTTGPIRVGRGSNFGQAPPK